MLYNKRKPSLKDKLLKQEEERLAGAKNEEKVEPRANKPKEKKYAKKDKRK